jgi:hypothetical protein
VTTAALDSTTTTSPAAETEAALESTQLAPGGDGGAADAIAALEADNAALREEVEALKAASGCSDLEAPTPAPTPTPTPAPTPAPNGGEGEEIGGDESEGGRAVVEDPDSSPTGPAVSTPAPTTCRGKRASDGTRCLCGNDCFECLWDSATVRDAQHFLHAGSRRPRRAPHGGGRVSKQPRSNMCVLTHLPSYVHVRQWVGAYTTVDMCVGSEIVRRRLSALLVHN